MLNKYKHVIWDWNGTLLNDVDLCVGIINNILTKRELDILTSEKYREIFTFPVKDYYVKAGLDFNLYSFETLGMEWMTDYETNKLNTYLFDGAEEILKFIFNAGISQSILSAYPHETLVEIVSLHKLEKYFKYITGLDHIFATSKVDIGKKLIKRIGLPENEVVLIGDTIHDFEVSTEIGAECILIANGHQSRNRLLSCGVPVLNSINELTSKI